MLKEDVFERSRSGMTPFPQLCKDFARRIDNRVLGGREFGSREKAAAYLGVPLNTFNKWCDGAHKPAQEQLLRERMEGWKP